MIPNQVYRGSNPCVGIRKMKKLKTISTYKWHIWFVRVVEWFRKQSINDSRFLLNLLLLLIASLIATDTVDTISSNLYALETYKTTITRYSPVVKYSNCPIVLGLSNTGSLYLNMSLKNLNEPGFLKYSIFCKNCKIKDNLQYLPEINRTNIFIPSLWEEDVSYIIIPTRKANTNGISMVLNATTYIYVNGETYFSYLTQKECFYSGANEYGHDIFYNLQNEKEVILDYRFENK